MKKEMKNMVINLINAKCKPIFCPQMMPAEIKRFIRVFKKIIVFNPLKMRSVFCIRYVFNNFCMSNVPSINFFSIFFF